MAASGHLAPIEKSCPLQLYTAYNFLFPPAMHSLDQGQPEAVWYFVLLPTCVACTQMTLLTPYTTFSVNCIHRFCLACIENKQTNKT